MAVDPADVVRRAFLTAGCARGDVGALCDALGVPRPDGVVPLALRAKTGPLAVPPDVFRAVMSSHDHTGLLLLHHAAAIGQNSVVELLLGNADLRALADVNARTTTEV
jgi:ankyrin repeat protein